MHPKRGKYAKTKRSPKCSQKGEKKKNKVFFPTVLSNSAHHNLGSGVAGKDIGDEVGKRRHRGPEEDEHQGEGTARIAHGIGVDGVDPRHCDDLKYNFQ